MINKIVKYDNELNSVPFRKFNNREFNIFFSMISKLREQGTKKVTFSFDDIKELSDYKQHGKNFINDLDSLYTKMLSLKIWRKSKHISEKWVLFIYYQIDEDNRTITIAINPDMEGIVNSLAQWTRFALKQFVDLRSTYSKTVFRLLKQYRTVGKRYFSVDEFRTLLDIPESYASNDINKRVLRPIKEELPSLFKGLSISKKYQGQGRKINGYLFSWKPESKDVDDFSKGSETDKQRKIDNIRFNVDLTAKEKENAINKIKGNNNVINKKNESSKSIGNERPITDDPSFNKEFDDYYNF